MGGRRRRGVWCVRFLASCSYSSCAGYVYVWEPRTLFRTNSYHTYWYTNYVRTVSTPTPGSSVVLDDVCTHVPILSSRLEKKELGSREFSRTAREMSPNVGECVCTIYTPTIKYGTVKLRPKPSEERDLQYVTEKGKRSRRAYIPMPCHAMPLEHRKFNVSRK
jgi:hypothetical protein